MRKNLRLVKPGEESASVPKKMYPHEPAGEELLWMTAPTDEKSIAYTWTPSHPPAPAAARPRVRRRK